MSEEPEPTGSTVVEEKREVVIPERHVGFQHWPQFLLAILLTAMVCLIILAEFFSTVPDGNQRVIDTLSGSVMTAWLGSMGYWYNTTFGSNNKTRMLAQASPTDPHI